MKKTLFTLLVLIASIATVTAGGPGGNQGPSGNGGGGQQTVYNSENWTYNDGVFTFKSAFVWTSFTEKFEDRGTSTNENTWRNNNTLVELGFYTIAEDGTIGEKVALVKHGNDGDTQNSVIFKAGDKVGIYAKVVETANGEVTYTTSNTGNSDETTVVNNVDMHTRNTDDPYFCLYHEQYFGQYAHYEYHLAGTIAGDNYDDFINDVNEANTDENGNPITTIVDSNGKPVTGSGGPLPGLLMTLGIGGAAMAAVRNRKKQPRA